MELIYLGIKAISSNWWRSCCLLVALISVGLYTAIHIQSLRLREAKISFNEEKAKIAKLVVDGIVAERKIAVAGNELTALRKKQVAQAKSFAGQIKNFPKDCEGAAQKAASILRERSK